MTGPVRLVGRDVPIHLRNEDRRILNWGTGEDTENVPKRCRESQKNQSSFRFYAKTAACIFGCIKVTYIDRPHMKAGRSHTPGPAREQIVRSV